HVYDSKLMGDAYGTGRATRTNSSTNSYNINQLLNYTRRGDKHGVEFFVGHENYMNYYDYLSGAKRGIAIDGAPVLDNFGAITDLSSYDRYYTTEGYFSRFNYNYDGRYLFSGSLRRDGTS